MFTTGQMYLKFLILYLLVVACGCLNHRGIYLSRFSSVDNVKFRNLVDDMTTSEKTGMVYIPTATFAYNKDSLKSVGEQRRRARYDAKIKADLLSVSMSIKDIKILNIDDPHISTTDIQKSLENAKIIYIDGGNTFYLQFHLLRTHFWETILPYLERDCLYIGASAGAIVAGQSISTAFWKGWDDPHIVPNFEWDDQTLQGYCLFNYSVFPHYNDILHENLVNSKLSTLNHSVLTLEDNEIFVIPGGCPYYEEKGEDASSNALPTSTITTLLTPFSSDGYKLKFLSSS